MAGPCCGQFLLDIDPNHLEDTGGCGNPWESPVQLRGLPEVQETLTSLCHNERKLAMLESHTWCRSRERKPGCARSILNPEQAQLCSNELQGVGCGVGQGRELSQPSLPGHPGPQLALGTPVNVSKQGQKGEFLGCIWRSHQRLPRETAPQSL